MKLLSAGRGALAVGLTLGMLPLALPAHDYWLQADDFSPDASAPLVVHLYLGEDLKPDEEKPYEAERTERFELRLSNDVRDLMAVTADGTRPIFNDTLASCTPLLFTLVRSAAEVQLDAAEFNEYVSHEGISGVSATHPRERERYWRFIKLLGRCGSDTETDLHHRFTGAQFEIVLLQNPFTMQPGDEQIVQLLFDTHPLPATTVFALQRSAEGTLTRLSAVTDARGVARFTLPSAGMWLIRAVHMRPCKCKDVDWESFWADYTFELH